jgi:hypothetical protein
MTRRFALAAASAWLLAASIVAAAPASDLRPLVELKMDKYWDFPEDSAVTTLQVFRNGLLHFEDRMYWERSECPWSYAYGLGFATPAQLAELDAALTATRLGRLTGDCNLKNGGDADATDYRIDWTSSQANRSNRLIFYSGSLTFDPPPPPRPFCDPRLAKAKDAILAFAAEAMALKSTRVVRGSACYRSD